jgi:hypothetical protein
MIAVAAKRGDTMLSDAWPAVKMTETRRICAKDAIEFLMRNKTQVTMKVRMCMNVVPATLHYTCHLTRRYALTSTANRVID